MGTAQPTLANFGSATFSDMTYNPASPGAAFLSAIDMIDESGNVIATAGPTTSNGLASSFTDSYVPSERGYWLVGSDGGIFSFGQAQFYGSTGSLHLQRPVVGIVPTADHGGYWLDASDGGVFSYGDTQFYGSIPGLGLHPAGSGLPNSLNAPIVGMVPSNRRQRLLHGGLRRRGLRLRRCPLRRVVPGHRRLCGLCGGRHARRQRGRVLARDLDGERLHVR